MAKKGEKIEKEIFLENLPRHKNRTPKDDINWNECIGEFIKFKHGHITGYLQIISFDKVKNILTIRYKNYHSFDIKVSSFVKCQLRTYLSNVVISAPWMIPYFQGGYEEAKLYTKSSSKFIYPVCPYCGNIKDILVKINDIYNKKYVSCECSYNDKIPYPEKFMYSVFKQLKINFKTQLSKTTFKWCDKYRYDFYFEYKDEKYVLETHGNQHYQDGTGNFIKNLKEEQENDRLKKELALQNGIKEENYIVIDCRYSNSKWIKEHILESKLSKLFDLTLIEWIKSEEFVLSNRVKEACEYKRNNTDMTTADISKIMKLSQGTIMRYLKQGNEVGWCYYNAKEEKEKGVGSFGGKCKKPIKVFKNDKFLGVFESAYDLERQSEKLFGIKLKQTGISNVSLGKTKLYKGFFIIFA